MRRRTVLMFPAVILPALAIPALAAPDWHRGFRELRYCESKNLAVPIAAKLEAYLRHPVRPLTIKALGWNESLTEFIEAFRTGLADCGTHPRREEAKIILGDQVISCTGGSLIKASLPSAVISAILDAWEVL